MKILLSIYILCYTFVSFTQSVKPKCLEGNCRNKIGTYLYADSSIYIGSFNDKLKNGKGKMNYINGSYYDGDWQLDKKNGKGKMNYSDGSSYEGDWQMDNRNGKGKMYYSDGSSYEGDWSNDKRNGNGVYIDSIGNKYEGLWVDDKENGKGKYTDLKGNVYEGSWTNGALLGYITLRYKNKSLYEGEYNNGISGKGKFTYSDGSVYTGNFAKNKRSGYGELAYSFDLTYKGNWVSNEVDGQGEFYLTSNKIKIAEGNWKTDKTNPSDSKFISSNELMICYYANKNLYYGKSQKGLPNGIGTMKYSNGDIYEGNFERGLMSGNGRFKYKDIGEYNGEWKNGLKDGSGILIKADNSILKGYWKVDLYIGHKLPENTLKMIVTPEKCDFIEKGGIIGKGKCKDGLKDGEWLYISNGILYRKENFKKGIQNGEFYESYYGGRSVNYMNGLKEGIEKTLNEVGQIVQTTKYSKGILIDTAFRYYDPRSNDGFYLHDIIIFDPLIAQKFPDYITFNQDPWDERDGKVIEYFPNGNVKKIINLFDRELCGEYKEYDANGTLIADLIYENCDLVRLEDEERIVSGWWIKHASENTESETNEVVKLKKFVYKNGCLIEILINDKSIWKGLKCEEFTRSFMYEYQENGIKLTQNISADQGFSYNNVGSRSYISGLIQSSEIDGKTTLYKDGMIKSRQNDFFKFNVEYLQKSENERIRQGVINNLEIGFINIRECRFEPNSPYLLWQHSHCCEWYKRYLLNLEFGAFFIEGYSIQNSNTFRLKSYFLQNQIIDSVYKNDVLIERRVLLPDGVFIISFFYPNGKLKCQMNYLSEINIHYDHYNEHKHSILEGPFEMYYDNSKPKFSAFFENDTLVGIPKYYDQNGIEINISKIELDVIKDEELKLIVEEIFKNN